jgi:ligand-binding sensor domain-containing protein
VLCALQVAQIASACAGAGRAGSPVRRGVSDRDVLLLRQHSDVRDVSVNTRSLFALTTSGVIVYDRIFNRWRTPDARLAQDLTFAGVDDSGRAILAADPVEDAVWIGIPGALVLYRVAASQVQRITVTGIPHAIVFGANGGDAFVRSSGQWWRVSRAGFVSPVVGAAPPGPLVAPTQLPDVYEAHPSLRGQLPFLLRTARGPDAAANTLPMARVSTGTMAPDRPGEVFLGTIGDGVWQLDVNFLQATRLPYGLLDDRVAALARGANGVWSVGAATAADPGLTFVAQDAASFAWRRLETGNAPRGASVNQMVVRAGVAWIASDRGVWRVPLHATRDAADDRLGGGGDAREDARGITHWSTLDGLPDDVTYTVLPVTGGTWVGTRRGLAFIAAEQSEQFDDREVAPRPSRQLARAVPLGRVADAEPVLALSLLGTRLLMATPSGIVARDADADAEDAGAAERPIALREALGEPVVGMAHSDSLLLVITQREARLMPASNLAARSPSAPVPSSAASLSPSPADSTQDVRAIGLVRRAAMDARAAWIAGASGVLVWPRDRSPARLLEVGRDLPAEVTDVALDDEFAWIGTARGLLRIRRASNGGVP